MIRTFEETGLHRSGIAVEGRRVDLVELARAQGLLILAVGVGLMIQLILPLAARPLAGMAPTVLMITVLAAFQIVWVVAVIVLTIRLAQAGGGSTIVAILMGILLLVPVVGLLCLLRANRRATGILARANVRVGLLGVGAEEMRKLVDGGCQGCGYDIRSVTGGVKGAGKLEEQRSTHRVANLGGRWGCALIREISG